MNWMTAATLTTLKTGVWFRILEAVVTPGVRRRMSGNLRKKARDRSSWPLTQHKKNRSEINLERPLYVVDHNKVLATILVAAPSTIFTFHSRVPFHWSYNVPGQKHKLEFTSKTN
jgi:hypothetical protein